MSRVRSHRLPQNEEPHRGAKAGLGKHTERMRSLARTKAGGIHVYGNMCMVGGCVSFLKEKQRTVWPVRDKRM